METIAVTKMGTIFWLVSLMPAIGLAVEPGIIAERFQLIGAINSNANDAPGIAVIRDRVAAKSLFVKEGDVLVERPRLWVTQVSNRFVGLSDGTQTFRLQRPGFDGASSTYQAVEVPAKENNESDNQDNDDTPLASEEAMEILDRAALNLSIEEVEEIFTESESISTEAKAKL